MRHAAADEDEEVRREPGEPEQQAEDADDGEGAAGMLVQDRRLVDFAVRGDRWTHGASDAALSYGIVASNAKFTVVSSPTGERRPSAYSTIGNRASRAGPSARPLSVAPAGLNGIGRHPMGLKEWPAQRAGRNRTANFAFHHERTDSFVQEVVLEILRERFCR